MGEIKKNYKVKLICGVLFNPDWCQARFQIDDISKIPEHINSIVEENLSQLLKFRLKIDFKSEIINFDFTNYYNEEMGEKILRYWISFEPVIELTQPYKIKHLTNDLEQQYFSDEAGNRKVNLDPGYVEGSKLVLFSTKNYSHRIYLDEGIYAEVTLIYKHSKFEILPWTYPDYKTESAIKFFTQVRELWRCQQVCS